MRDDWLRDIRAAVQSARVTGRQIVVDGVAWLVYEMPADRLDRRSSSSLVFESDDAMRRVRNYPADWRESSDEALLALSWSR